MNKEKLWAELKRIVEALGYRFVGMETVREEGFPVLRVYADCESGIGVEDCEKISTPISAMLDERAEEFEDSYLLEVSSPGLERPLFSLEDYGRFAGREAAVKFKAPVEGRRRLTARIVETKDGAVIFDCDGTPLAIPFESIAAGHLIYKEEKGQKITFSGKGRKKQKK
ncbi:MAG: ribosome maturation factor RimP [Pyramidobacter sp.]|jgi:ribosome maturation factor RimP